MLAERLFFLVVNLYIIYVGRVADTDQFFDTNHNFNNVGPRTNSQGIVYKSNSSSPLTQHFSKSTDIFLHLVMNST